MSVRGPCTICEAPTHGLHFGVSTCKACASFFRRSMVERKRYKCRFQNNCIINNQARNQCRACRLRKCYNSGMVREPSPIPTEPSNHGSMMTSPMPVALSPQTSFSFSPQQPIPSIPPQLCYQQGLSNMKTAYPLMDRMLAAFRSFHESSRSLYKVENPHIPDLPEEFRQIEKQQHDRLETDTNSLIMSMVNEYFPSFYKLDPKARIRIFRPFAVRFSILYRVYISALYFNKEGDERVCTHYGYYNSLETLHLFFGDIPEIADAKALAVPVFTKFNQVKRKAIRIGLREIDVAALIGVFFTTEIEDLLGFENEHHKYKTDLQNELFHNIIATYGLERAGTQLAEILGLMVDINMLCVVSTESMILEDLVLPKNNLLQSYLYVDPKY